MLRDELSQCRAPLASAPKAGNTRQVAAGVQCRKKFDECLFAFADRRQIDGRLFQHPTVVCGDFRPAQEDAEIGPRFLQLPGDPDRPLDVPQITSKANQRRLAIEDRRRQRLVAEHVAKPCRKDVDRPALQPLTLGK